MSDNDHPNDHRDGPKGPSESIQGSLDLDAPVPYALTARGKRAVDPTGAPSLRVVPDADESAPAEADPLEDPADPRRAQARALRRAGMPAGAIAKRLGVDLFTVRAWLGGRMAGATLEAVSDASDAASEHHRRRRELAANAASSRLESDAAFAAGVGLLTAIAETDPHAVTLVSERPAVVQAAITWLSGVAHIDEHRLRVVLRLGRSIAGDRAVHEWAAATGLPAERFRHVAWKAAPGPDAVEALVRVGDPELAASVAGWTDALLARVTHEPGTADLGS